MKRTILKKFEFYSLSIVILICSILVVSGMLSLQKAGGIAILMAGSLATFEVMTRRHYQKTQLLLRRLDELVKIAEPSGPEAGTITEETDLKITYDPRGKTAVLLVSGFNGLGLHTLFSVIRLFGSSFRNFVFLQVGVLDGQSIKDPSKVSYKMKEVSTELDRYVNYMRRHGYYAVGYPSCGTEIVHEIVRISPEILAQYPNTVFFGGQLVFPKAVLLTRFFHNYTIFAVQEKFYSQGIPVVILPIRVC